MKRRNYLACAEIMRKGGVHEKTPSSKRFKQKQAQKKQIDQYFREAKGRKSSDLFFVQHVIAARQLKLSTALPCPALFCPALQA